MAHLPMDFRAIWSRMRSQPDTVNTNDISTDYWYNYLYRVVCGQIVFDGVPAGWDLDYMYDILLTTGYFTICDTPAGVLPLRCTYTGINVFNHPTQCVVTNEIFESTLERTIDVDCALVHIRPNYTGIGDTLTRYSTLLAMCDASIMTNLFNTRTARIYKASSKNESASYKKMYEDIMRGQPAVFVGEAISPGEFFDSNIQQHFIATDVHQLNVSILNDFYTEFGIANSNTEKRERLVQAEVGAKDNQVRASIQNMLVNIQNDFDTANRLFGLQLRVSLLSDRGGVDGDIVQSDTMDARGID